MCVAERMCGGLFHKTCHWSRTCFGKCVGGEGGTANIRCNVTLAPLTHSPWWCLDKPNLTWVSLAQKRLNPVFKVRDDQRQPKTISTGEIIWSVCSHSLLASRVVRNFVSTEMEKECGECVCGWCVAKGHRDAFCYAEGERSTFCDF